jgi:hypothetical protein
MPEGELFEFRTRLLLPELRCFQVREGYPPASAFASRFARMLLHVRPPAAACAVVLSMQIITIAKAEDVGDPKYCIGSLTKTARTARRARQHRRRQHRRRRWQVASARAQPRSQLAGGGTRGPTVRVLETVILLGDALTALRVIDPRRPSDSERWAVQSYA